MCYAQACVHTCPASCIADVRSRGNTHIRVPVHEGACERGCAHAMHDTSRAALTTQSTHAKIPDPHTTNIARLHLTETYA